MDEDVENFLAHHGVKGMKWGQRKDRTTTTPRDYTALKKLGAEVGYGSIGPAAMLAGLGPPISVAIGVSVHVLRQPAVRKAIANTSKASASLVKELGSTKLSAMSEANELKRKVKQMAG